jgi:type II secretory pathway component PulK
MARRIACRRGVVLIVVIVCLMVAAAMGVGFVRQIAAERQAVRAMQTRLQAAWLAEAGVERAAAQLADDSAYAGETWNIPAAELSASDAAVVRIRVENVVGRPERRAVAVEADYPENSALRARQTKRVMVERNAK